LEENLIDGCWECWQQKDNKASEEVWKGIHMEL
jgi:hypothetical protein